VIGSVAGVVGAGVLLLGLTLASIGLYGMLRKPAIFEQLHAAGLVTGPGVILVLLASLASASAEIATSAVLVVVFVLVTSSLSTHAIALAAWRREAASTPGGGRVDANASALNAGEAGMSRTAMRVLLAYDGSPGADMAIDLAATLGWPDGSMIRMIAAIEGDLPQLSAIERSQEPLRGEPVEPAVALAAAARKLQRPGLGVEHVVRRGRPATTIIDEAKALSADLVVVGSRGLGWVQTLLMGSVASAVVDGARCPVLVVRAPSVHEVLLATDGSSSSVAATDFVARWPIFQGMRIQVLSVATSVPQHRHPWAASRLRDALETARQKRIATAAAMKLGDAGGRALPRVGAGDAAARILGLAESQSIDLIILGSRGRTGLKRALLGSVARDVLSMAQTSVLVVRAVGESAERPGEERRDG
jgi:monovalent cation/proton antiporter MnhG/PhaG subunit